jgi:hypothetical protein
MSLSQKIDEFYNTFLQNGDTEFEVRFGTKGGTLNKNKLDNTINKLKSLGFGAVNTEHTLKIQPEFVDPKIGRKKISSVRVEISGLPSIQNYCKTDKIVNERGRVNENIVFTRKQPLFMDEKKFQPYDVDEFNFRLSIQKDFKMNQQEGVVKGLLSNWESSKKVFRYMKRTTFRHTSYPFSIDVSIVKMSNKNSKYFMIPTYTLLESNVLNNPNTYELEIECDRVDHGRSKLYQVIKYVLSGIQNSNFPIKQSDQQRVQKAYYKLIYDDELSKRLVPKNFVGPSSISLELHHLQKDSNVNILNNYCVTDKADGVRKLLYIHPDKKIYLIDMNMNIEFTGLMSKSGDFGNTIIDGEHIIHDKKKTYYNKYAAFDIYFINNTDVRDQPFIDDSKKNRLTLLNHIMKKMGINELVKSSTNLTLVAKQFYKSDNIFTDCKSILSTLDALDYETDGLILTPSDYAVGNEEFGQPISNIKKTWMRSFKWKPPEFNTIDFFISVKKSMDGIHDIKNIFEEGKSTTSLTNIQEYKTLTLRVGYDESKHGYMNPLQTIIDNVDMQNKSDDSQNYKPVRFYPMEPSDINAGECHIMVDTLDKNMICENGDIIDDNAIVEFKYVIGNKEKFKWVPIRVRYDKMSELMAGFKNYGNAYHVAESVWKSIHNPVTAQMLSGVLDIPKITSDIYYKSSDKKTSRAMRDFHNLFIKKQLIKATTSDGFSLMDLAVGKGGDIPKWIHARLSFVYGIDISVDNIENRKDGACARYLDMKKKKRIFDGLFVPGDSSKIMSNGDAFYSPKISNIHKAVFGKGPKDRSKLGEGIYNLYGKASDGFDVVSCQFAIHYMFESKDKLYSFVRNLSESCKIGGYFIGTCYDGKKIFNLMDKLEINNGITKYNSSKNRVWEVVKKYDFKTFEDNDSCLGYAIDVYQDSINNMITEYLVNFEYLKIVMEHFGFVVIDDLEAQTLQLTKGITGFEDAYKSMETYVSMNKDEQKYIGKSLHMTKEEKYVSFLNNYFVFKKVRHIEQIKDDSNVSVKTRKKKIIKLVKP